MNALVRIDGDNRRRIVATAGLLTSDRDGEALSATRALVRLLDRHGLAPADVVSAGLETVGERPAPGAFRPGPQTRPAPVYPSAKHQRLARLCLGQSVHLNDWERGFLSSIVAERTITLRQQEKLNSIAAKIDAGIAAATAERARKYGDNTGEDGDARYL